MDDHSTTEGTIGSSSDPNSDAPIARRVGSQLYWLIPTLVAAIVAAWDLAGWSVWYDEAATWSAVTRPLGQMLRLLQFQDQALGAYYLLMRPWVAVFGTSEIALRLPSVLAAAAAAGATAMIARRHVSATAGLIAGLMLAAMPSVTSSFAREARPYAMTMLLATVATLVLLELVERPRRAVWLGYVAAVAGLGALHFLALTLLLSHLVYVWVQRRVLVVRWAIAAGIGSLPGLAVAGLAWAGDQRWAWIRPPRQDELLSISVILSGGTVVGWLLLILAVASVRRGTIGRQLLLWTWFLGPAVVLAVLTLLVQPMFTIRYVLLSAPALAILASAGLVRLASGRSIRGTSGGRVVVALGLALVVLAAMPDAAGLRSLPSRRGDYRGAASILLEQQVPGDAVLFSKAVDRLGMSYYLVGRDAPEDIRLLVGPEQRRSFRAKERPVTRKLLAPYRRIWLVSSRDPTVETEPTSDELAGHRLASSQKVQGLWVHLYERAD